MDILEINRNTLANLWQMYQKNLNGLNLNGKYLTYNNDAVDISNFNINDLLSSECSFASYITNLTPQDIFNIIKVHALFTNNNLLPVKAIPEESTFYNTINSSTPLNEQDQKNVNAFLNFIDTLSNYEDCLLPPLKQILTNFNNYALTLKTDETIPKTEGHKLVIQKYNELTTKQEKQATTKQTKDSPKLEKKYNETQKGNIDPLEVLIIVLSFATTLTFLTLYFIK